MESTARVLANQALDAYARDMEGFTHRDCLELSEASLGGEFDDYIADHQCEILEGVLGEGIHGEITCEEIGSLMDSGFSAEFVKELAGRDGTRAIRERARWMGKTFAGYDASDQREVLEAAAAVVALEAMGPYSAEAIPFLRRALRDERMQVRKSAARAIGHARPEAVRELPGLAVLLDSEDTLVRWEAARTIAQIGNSGIEYLIVALDHWNSDAKKNVIAALGSVGSQAKDAVPRLIEILEGLEDRDEIARPFFYECPEHETIRTLGSIGDERAVPVLIELSGYKDSMIRSLAVEALGKIGSAKGYGTLRRALRDEDVLVRDNAFGAILLNRPPWIISALEYAYRNRIGLSCGRSGCWRPWVDELGSLDPGQAVSLYSRLLSSTDEEVRCDAARSLGELGSVKAVPRFVGMLSDNSDYIRMCAADALGYIGPDAAGAITPLARMLDEEDRVAVSAARALAAIGEEAIPAIASVYLLRERSDSLCHIAYGALERLVTVEAVPGLMRALRSPDWRIAWGAASGLAHIGEKAAEALPSLAAALRHGRPDVRAEAASAIGAIGPKEAIGPLTRALEDRGYYVVKNAAEALEAAGLGKGDVAGLLNKVLGRGCNSPSTAMVFIEYSPDVGEDARARLAPAIARALRSKDIQTRGHAAELLGSLGPAADAAVPRLVRAINAARSEELIGFYAMQSLGKIGTDSAVGALIKFARGSNSDEKGMAIWALSGLRSKPPEVISILTAAAMDSSADFLKRHDLIDVLGKTGSSAAEALPALEGIMRNVEESGGTRIQAARVYKEISGETPLSIWRDLRNDRDDAVRRRAQAIVYYKPSAVDEALAI